MSALVTGLYIMVGLIYLVGLAQEIQRTEFLADAADIRKYRIIEKFIFFKRICGKFYILEHIKIKQQCLYTPYSSHITYDVDEAFGSIGEGYVVSRGDYYSWENVEVLR